MWITLSITRVITFFDKMRLCAENAPVTHRFCTLYAHFGAPWRIGRARPAYNLQEVDYA